MTDADSPGSRTRRELLRDAATVGAAGALALSPQESLAVTGHRRRRSRREVAVLGGGVGGLTAAHELAERGFRVTVYERNALGGKARSFGVPRTADGGRRPLPAEHGMRFFAGFYQNVPDTMRRIPFGSNANGAFDNLIAAPTARYSRWGGRSDFSASYAPDPYPWTIEAFREVVVGYLELTTHLPPHEIAYFVERLLVFCSSGDARRFGQWERTSWWDFVAADRFSEEYRRVLVSSVTRFLLAAKATEASARTIGLLWQAGIYNLMGRGSNGPFDRILDGPTNEAWIDPWVAHLRRLGVKFRLGTEVQRLELRGGRIVGAQVCTPRGRKLVAADWFVCALPAERARRLWSGAILARDPGLRRMARLRTSWQNGLQFYVREPTPISHGHVLYEDSPWALSSISQAQFWPGNFARRYGDGSVRDCISVDISDFDAPGILYRTPARQLRPAQIARDAWAQMKAHLNDTGRDELRDDVLVSWFLDPALVHSRRTGAIMRNTEPLLISTVGAWENRPEATTAIPNLFLAADYVRVSIDTACMEGANHAARLATNALIAAAGSRAEPAATYDLYQPPEWEPSRRTDDELFRRGQRNPLDVPLPG